MFENSLTNCIPVSINSLKSKDFEPSESSALLSISFMSIILYHTAMYTIITFNRLQVSYPRPIHTTAILKHALLCLLVQYTTST